MKFRQFYSKDNYVGKVFSCSLIVVCYFSAMEYLNYQSLNNHDVTLTNQINDMYHKIQLLQNRVKNCEMKFNSIENRINELIKTTAENNANAVSNDGFKCLSDPEFVKLKADVSNLAKNVVILLEKSNTLSQSRKNTHGTWRQKLSNFFTEGFAFSKG